MPQYRRYRVPGATVFLTMVTFDRRPLFADSSNIHLARRVLVDVHREWPFSFDAAVVLPDHLHFLWTLPERDVDYSKRIGRMKALFTKRLRSEYRLSIPETLSRLGQHEGTVWQRRFYEHTIRDDDDFKAHIDYIHYNPVKHGFVKCPHEWQYSSFMKWVRRGEYVPEWGCVCYGGMTSINAHSDRIAITSGE